MKWIYPFIVTFIRLTEGQTLISNTECPALDELVRVNAKNSIDLIKEMEELKKEKQRLLYELSLQREWMKRILVQSNGIMDCMWYKIMDPDVQSGVYNLIVGERDFQAYCDMETDGGGWTVIVSRDPESSIDMNRSWQEYKHGFGNVAGPFYWIGNDNIHELTKQRPSDVYIKIEHKLHGSLWVKYTKMTVLSEEYKYRLSFDENSFVGPHPYERFKYHEDLVRSKVLDKLPNTEYTMIGNILGGFRYKPWSVQNMTFSTYDSDIDGWTYGNCAELFKGGWWYNHCGFSMTNQTLIMGFEMSELRPGNMMMIRFKTSK